CRCRSQWLELWNTGVRERAHKYYHCCDSGRLLWTCGRISAAFEVPKKSSSSSIYRGTPRASCSSTNCAPRFRNRRGLHHTSGAGSLCGSAVERCGRKADAGPADRSQRRRANHGQRHGDRAAEPDAHSPRRQLPAGLIASRDPIVIALPSSLHSPLVPLRGEHERHQAIELLPLQASLTSLNPTLSASSRLG